MGIEEALEAERPDAAVAVGTGEAALALAITASKLGVPLAASAGAVERDGADERRILATLAALDAGAGPRAGGRSHRLVAERGAARLAT